jgi:hypothetical protein
MKSPFDVLPAIGNPKLPFEPYPGATGVVGHIFLNTDTTYKFFWFLALLEETKATLGRTDFSPKWQSWLARWSLKLGRAGGCSSSGSATRTGYSS